MEAVTYVKHRDRMFEEREIDRVNALSKNLVTAFGGAMAG